MTPNTLVFVALADPTRRAILDLLREGERSVTELTEPFHMTQPAVSKHLGILRRSRLIRSRWKGRHNLYRLNAEPMRAVADWLAHYERFWNEKLTGLGKHLEENP